MKVMAIVVRNISTADFAGEGGKTAFVMIYGKGIWKVLKKIGETERKHIAPLYCRQRSYRCCRRIDTCFLWCLGGGNRAGLYINTYWDRTT